MGKQLMRSTTLLEVLGFTKTHYRDCDYGFEVQGDIVKFVANHVKHDAVVFSRGDDGRIRGVLYGWPIDMSTAREGDGCDDSIDIVHSGDCFYINMLIMKPGLSQAESLEVLAHFGATVKERWKRYPEYVAYHRAKYGERFKIRKYNGVEDLD